MIDDGEENGWKLVGRVPRREFTAGALAALGLVAAGCGSERAGTSPAGLVADPTSTIGPINTETPLGSIVTPLTPEPIAVGLTERYGTVTERNRNPGADGVAVNAVVKGLNQFAVDAYLEAVSAPDTRNALLGNYSLATALLLTLSGMDGDLREANATMLGVDQIDRAALDPAVNAIDLILEDRATDGLEILTANRLFVSPGLPLVPGFLDTAVGHYDAAVTETDFATDPSAAVEAVNSWIAEQTDGFIEELVQSFDPNTVISLVNAVYLKARWAVSFNTKDLISFTTATGSVVKAPSFGHDDFLPQYRDDEVVAVELPYVGGNLSMVVMMPADLEAFESSLTADRVGEITAGLQERGIHFTLPKWSFEHELDGIALLEPLGLEVAGDFSAMFDGGESGFFIDQINHKARIEVDETGTTAAAATNVVVASSHGPTIVIDRPFTYVIRDRGSNSILFIGRVTDPTQTS